ncbi:hypothetical protein, partial [Methylobacterium crusticola]|uniref:hypothetical protein n=1 Tax=Methylobacterium crusticola TaxID=1697972 RepID=UPI001939E122
MGRAMYDLSENIADPSESCQPEAEINASRCRRGKGGQEAMIGKEGEKSSRKPGGKTRTSANQNYNPELIIKSFNTWAFKREQPGNAER